MFYSSLAEELSKRGYLVCRNAIELNVTQKMHDYLTVRLDHLRQKFQHWSGAKDIFTIEGYRRHSDLISVYEVQGLPKDLRHFLTGEFDLETRLSSEVQQFLSNPALRQVAANALGESLYFVHYPPMLRFKVANANHTIVPPHQDIAYNAHLGKFISIWVPFTPITEEVRGVEFYEHTQELEELPHTASGAWASRVLWDESNCFPFSPKMELGDILFFTSNIIHRSGVNTDENVIRFSLDLRIFSQKTTSPKPYYDPWKHQVLNFH